MARASVQRKGGGKQRRQGWWIGWAIFGLALVLRLLFWQATVDAGWPGSAQYKGDAWVWVDYAAALQQGVPFQLDVPLRPPGAAYLLDALWAGGSEGLRSATVCWLLLGAWAVALFYAAARRAFGLTVGVITGLLCAGSSGLMVLSTSLNNETPYLLLLGLIFWLFDRVAGAERLSPVAAWGALNALACLFRVEHALFFGLAVLWLAAGWWSSGARRRWTAVAVLAVAFGLTLLPWQLAIARELDRFNHQLPEVNAASRQAIEAQERALAYLEWTPAANAARDRLPAFIRQTGASFVAATVAHQGRRVVEEGDFQLLAGAFGYLPEDISSWPFIVVSGGLNFVTANHQGATGGFDPEPLTRRPPLAGGVAAYPPALISGLPPAELALAYPGHLRLINEGYGIGWAWLRGHPAAASRLVASKLAIAWRGATLGWSGWNLPLSAGGLRRAVDLTTPEGRWPALWRLLFLPLAVWGAILAWSRPPARLWLLFALSKVLVVMVFYGYARQGATTIPVIALLLALVGARLLERWGLEVRQLRRIAFSVALLLLALETARFVSKPELEIDGRRVGERDVLHPADHDAHRIAWR